MTAVYIFAAAVIGAAIGWALHGAMCRAVMAENQDLRAALRYVRRDLGIRAQLYIDRVLGDEAA